jgi:protein-tyrosine phosphatase
MNAAARTIVGLSRSAHVSAILADLHWLKVPERIKFKLIQLPIQREAFQHDAIQRNKSCYIRI